MLCNTEKFQDLQREREWEALKTAEDTLLPNAMKLQEHHGKKKAWKAQICTLAKSLSVVEIQHPPPHVVIDSGEKVEVEFPVGLPIYNIANEVAAAYGACRESGSGQNGLPFPAPGHTDWEEVYRE